MQTLALELKKIPSWVKNTSLVVGSSLIIGLFAHITIPLPFTPVPIATQPSLILLLSLFLGSKRAPAAVALFLAQGAIGLPVFSNGHTGLERFIGPTGGYLAGYLVAAYTVGRLAEMFGSQTFSKSFLAMFAGNVVLYAVGATWLSTFVGGMQNALLLGVVPFVLADIAKLALGYQLLSRFLRR